MKNKNIEKAVTIPVVCLIQTDIPRQSPVTKRKQSLRLASVDSKERIDKYTATRIRRRAV